MGESIGVAPAGAGTATRTRRAAPERAAEFEGFDFEELRTLRASLVEEENRISYWRRIVQARIDIMRANADEAGLAGLRTVLTERAGTGHRLALVDSTAHDQAPPLPDLVALWDADPRSVEDRARVLGELEAAEQALSKHRTTLHGWLDAATCELVARYRENPSLALRLLPLG